MISQKDKEDLEEISTELELADEDELVPYVSLPSNDHRIDGMIDDMRRYYHLSPIRYPICTIHSLKTYLTKAQIQNRRQLCPPSPRRSPVPPLHLHREDRLRGVAARGQGR